MVNPEEVGQDHLHKVIMGLAKGSLPINLLRWIQAVPSPLPK